MTLAAVVLLLLGGSLFRETLLDNAQRNFKALLESSAGRYNEGRLVLSQTNSRDASHIADSLGGSLRITKNGRFALISLPDGMRLTDVAANRELRQYMPQFSLDYNNFSLETEDSEVAADGDIRANFQTDEPMYPHQTYLDYINIGNSWNVSMGKTPAGEKVTIAVIDSGIDTDHPEFFDADGNCIISDRSYNASEDRIVRNDGIHVVEDKHGHGTAVAGVISSQLNGKGILGIAPDAELLVIKCDVYPNGTIRSSADIVFALYYAIEQDVDVINMSFAFAYRDDLHQALEQLGDALQLAVDSDIIPVAAAGNDGTATAYIPASSDNTIGVGSLAPNSWELHDTSNYGDNSDILAPGFALTAALEGSYQRRSGTSMAAPMVSAAVALYCSQHPHATYEEVKQNLLAAGRDLGEPGEDFYYGFGALDLNAFLCEEKGTITYDYCTEDLKETTQIFVKQHTIQTVPEPERENIIFDDWYYDKGYTRVFDYDAWYTTEFVEDVTLYAKWVNEDDAGASAYSYQTLEDGTIEIVSYKGKRRYLTVPDEIDGKTVSSIGIRAFEGNTRLREVILPSGLRTIRENAFDDVTRLRAVSFTGASLHTIEREAFSDCSSLRTLELPDSVVAIDNSAFAGCSVLSSVQLSENSALERIGTGAFAQTNLRSLYLPAHVSKFDGSALAYCRNMRSITLHPDNGAFVVQDGMVLSADRKTLVYYPAALTGTLTVPEGVTAIGSMACAASEIIQVQLPQSLTLIRDLGFADAKLQSVCIPANLIKIDTGAFQRNKDLTSLIYSTFTQLEEIGNAAFSECEQLSEVLLPGTLKLLGHHAFDNCQSITDIVIPDSVESIGNSAFQNCNALETVTFSPGCKVALIPDDCFSYCIKLKTVTFSDRIQALGTFAFQHCYSLRSLNFGADSALTTVGDYCFYACSSLNQMQLPDAVEEIGRYAYAFSGLISVHIPAKLVKIVDGAFGACDDLTEITVAPDHEVYAAVDHVLVSKDLTTVYCVPSSRAGSYTLPETIRVTAPGSFYYDRLLTEVILPEGLEEIRYDSFNTCTSLQSIRIPDSVTDIGRKAFQDCSAMRKVVFGNNSNLRSLGLYTFDNCAISEITIPASVESMAQYVFCNCSDLKQITFESGSRLTYVAAYLLSGTQVETVVFEDGSALTHLQAHAFDGAKYLKSVDFGDAPLETIDNYAFYDCSSLEDVAIADTVTYLGRYAFYGCTALERFDVPVSVDYIGISAFGGTNGKVFFAADALPANAQAGWDEGIAGYFLAAMEYVVTNQWEYVITFHNTVALSRYTGTEAALTLDSVDGYPVEKIGASCFADNQTVTTVTLGAGVREIDNGAFRNCAAVVAIPDDSILERIGSDAFHGTATESLNLPNTVTSIGPGAFEESKLTELKIHPDSSLRTIGDRAFYASTIAAIHLPASLETVGVEAFQNTRALTDVTIADGAAKLKLSNSAFESSGITELTIPARVYYIGEYAFGSCQSLQNIHVDTDNGVYQSLDGVLLDSSGTTLIQYPCGRTGAYEVPAQITVLNYASFKNACGLTAVTFAEGSTVKTIGWQTFSGCRNLKTVAVPNTVISFDFYAFENCTSLTDVLLAEGSQFTGVYQGAFYGCSALQNLHLPGTVIDIGDYAFYGCSSLAQFPFAEASQLKGIGAYAFYNCEKIQSIPEMGALTELGDYVFAESGIERFVVSETLRDIPSSAFAYCDQMMEIVCPAEHGQYDSIEGILYEKGANPSDLEAVVLWPWGRIYPLGAGKSVLTPEDTTVAYLNNFIHWEIADTVTIIENYAFENCETMISCEIPETVTSIGRGAFWGCTNLCTVRLPEGLTVLELELFAYCSSLKELEIPEGVTEIKREALMGTGLTEIRIPEHVEYIRSSAFYASDLIHLTIPKTVCAVDDLAFGNCMNLRSVVIEDGVSVLGTEAFRICPNLEYVSIPSSLTHIVGGTFAYCPKLQSAGPAGGGYNIEYSWNRYIPGNAFSGSTCLTKVVIGPEITEMGADAFRNCPNLTSAGPIGSGCSIEFPWTTEIPAAAFMGADCLQQIVFPEGVTKIGSSAFYWTALQSVTIPATVEELGGYLFEGCRGLTSAGPVGGDYDIQFYWTDRIPAYAFYGCDYLEQITIPDTITEIGYDAFGLCTSLKEIALPDGLRTLGSSSFVRCTDLREILLPESLTSIGNSAFDSCTGLTEMTIPAGVTKIEGYLFFGCTALEQVHLPDGITEIGAGAFQRCSKLSGIVIPESTAVMGEYVFKDCPLLETAGPVGGDYDIQFFWTDEIIPIAFFGCNSLKSVVIPDTVHTIGPVAFAYCRALTDVSQMESVTVLKNSAFRGCSALSRIELSSSLKEIETGVFDECSSLTQVIIPSEATTIEGGIFRDCPGLKTAGPIGGDYNIQYGWKKAIPEYAFYQCSSLEQITFPSGLEQIGSHAFYDCSALTELEIPENALIGFVTFAECTGLQSVIIPGTVTIDPEGRPFYGCTGLTSAGPIGGNYSIQFGWDAAIPTGAFECCFGLEQVVLSDTITEIGERALASCSALTEITIPKGVRQIGYSCFAGCTSLGTITFTGDAPQIGRRAFFRVNTTAYYPECNDTWTALVSKNTCADGTFTWVPYDPCGGAHSYASVITEPTCTEQGYTTHTCTICGRSYADAYVPALGHDMGVWETVTEATCTTDGSACRVCIRCTYSETQAIAATGHSFGNWFVNRSATCTEEGENRRNCQNCSHYETEVIPATGHDHKAVVTDPTCTEWGYTTHTCHCGNSFVDSYVDALGHDMGQWIVVTDATCTTDGSERRDCSRCDHFETRIIQAPGHSYVAHVTEPTCTEGGYTEYICSTCGGSYTSAHVPATGHNHKAVVTESTCTEQGYTTYTCHCGDRYISDYTNALGHDLGEWTVAVEPGCIEDGLEIQECSRCDHSERSAIDALGHDWDNGVVTVEPTEESDGEMTYTCHRCDETRTEIIPALKHEHQYETVVTAPTCTEQGCTTHTCSCGDSYVDSYVDALGHDMGVWYTVTEAACTTDGLEQRDCSRCDYRETQVIEASGHDYEAVVTEPTCTNAGFTTYTCHCGDSYVRDYTNPLDHSFTNYVSDGNAACIQDGTKTAVCDRCDVTDTQIDVGSARGHDFSDWIVVQEPTQTADGLESRTCYRCGLEETRGIPRLENPFTDVPEGSFYHAPVLWAVANGITNGTSATTFGPNDQCMRAHVVTFLWRAAGSPEPESDKNPFADVKTTDFYYKAVLWAVEKGITNGLDANHFGPLAYCNRAQVVTFLWRAKGCPESSGTDMPFTDVDVGAWYEAPIHWAVENGITNGMSATSFGINAICNRAQIVTFLYRAYN